VTKSVIYQWITELIESWDQIVIPSIGVGKEISHITIYHKKREICRLILWDALNPAAYIRHLTRTHGHKVDFVLIRKADSDSGHSLDLMLDDPEFFNRIENFLQEHRSMTFSGTGLVLQ